MEIRDLPQNIYNNKPLYAKYHQQLEEFEVKSRPVVDQQEAIYRQLQHNNGSAVRPAPNPPPPAMRQQISNSNQVQPRPPVIKKSNLDEFLRRKEEFERNRMRGKGLAQNPLVPKPPAYKRNNESMEEQLRRIRLQNFNSKKALLKEFDDKLANNNRNNGFRKEIADSANNNSIKKLAALRVNCALK